MGPQNASGDGPKDSAANVSEEATPPVRAFATALTLKSRMMINLGQWSTRDDWVFNLTAVLLRHLGVSAFAEAVARMHRNAVSQNS